MTDTTKLDIELEVHSAGEELVDSLTKKLARLQAQIAAITRLTKDVAKSASGRSVSSSGKDASGSTPSARPDREAAAVAKSIRAEARERERALRARFSFQGRMTRQREREESDVVAGIEREQRARENALRRQFAFSERMSRQRSRQEAEAEREIRREAAETARARDRDARRSAQEQRRQDQQTAREALASGRRAAADQRRSERDRDQGRDSIVRGAGQVRSGVGRAVAVGGATGAVLSYGSKRAIDSLTRSGVDIDAAMNANARMESGVSADEANKRASNIRTKSMPIARSLGIKTSEYLKARAEALQAGVDGEIVDAVTEFGSKYARINDLKANDVMESSGYGLTAMQSYGKVTPEVAKNFFNKMQYLAANTAASRQNLAGFSKRGLSAGASLGMSVDDSLAFGGAATASGADGEMAARMLASQGTRLAELKTKAADIGRKSHRTVKDREFLSLPRLFGFNNYRDLSASVSEDAAGTLEKIYAGIGQIADPVKRMQASELIFGKEFGPITAAMSKGGMFGKMRTAVRSKDANNAIDTGMNVRSGSFDFIMSQITATIQDLKDSLGLVLKPLWADIRDFVMKAPNAFKSFEDAFRSGLRGFLQGLGGDGTMAGLLKNWFGDPGQFAVNAKAVGDFARGFGQGLRDVGNAILAVIRAFAGSNASAEQMGMWTARLIGFCAACLVAAPAIAVLGGLATAISGLATMALGSWRILKAAGLVGAGVGAAPKVPVAPGVGAAGGLFGKMMGWLTVGTFSTTAGLNKADQDNLVLRLGKFAEEQEKAKNGDNSEPRAWTDPPSKTDKLKEAIDQNTKALREQQEKTARDLIKKTSLDSGGTYSAMKGEIQASGLSTWLRQNGHTGYDADESSNGGSAVNRGIRGHIGRVRGEAGAGYTSGVTNPGVTGDVATRAKTAYDFFRSKGLSREATSGILASMKQESNFTPNARGDGGRAHGLFQHHADRRAAIMRGTGIDMSNASFEKQLEGTWWEMNHGDKGAQRALGILKTPGISAGQAGAAFVQHFERPAKDERSSRGALAEGFSRQFGGGSTAGTVPGLAGNGGGSVAKRIADLRQQGAITGRECVDLVKAWTGTPNTSTRSWRKGDGAEAGTLKPGDSVATFLGPDGKPSSQYAGGTGGTRGAGRDHAGVFQDYVMGPDGKTPIGMRIMEQYRRSGGMQNSKTYMFGQGLGEYNGSNYSKVLGPDGKGLGGANVPALGEAAPMRSANTQAIGLGAGSAKGGGSSSGGAVIQINGHNGDPESLANAVQRRINDSMNRRSHDVDHVYT